MAIGPETLKDKSSDILSPSIHNKHYHQESAAYATLEQYFQLFLSLPGLTGVEVNGPIEEETMAIDNKSYFFSAIMPGGWRLSSSQEK